VYFFQLTQELAQRVLELPIHEGVYIPAVDSIAVRHASHDHGIDNAMLQHLGFEGGEAEVRVRVANEVVCVH